MKTEVNIKRNVRCLVQRKGPKCDCCGIRYDNRSTPDECDGCDGH